MDNSPVSAPQLPQSNGLPTPATGTLAASKSSTADNPPSPPTQDQNGTLGKFGEPVPPSPPSLVSSGAVTSAADVKESTLSTKPAIADEVPAVTSGTTSGSDSVSSPTTAPRAPIAESPAPAKSSAPPTTSSTSPAIVATTTSAIMATTTSATITATTSGPAPVSKSPQPPTITDAPAPAPKTPSKAPSIDAKALSSTSASSQVRAPWANLKYQWLLIILHWAFVLGPLFFLRVVLLSAAAYVVYAILTVKQTLATLPRKFREDKGVKKIHYDVAIVGAGPAGSTLAYYLAKAGRNVLLLEKKTFPRDKYCGDAVCKTGVEILMDMGICDDLIREGKARVADSGGLVSPGGLSYIGKSLEIMGDIPAAIACKRLHLDNAIAMAAKKAGADLKENSSVSDATLDETSGLWSVTVEGSRQPYQARVLACCDGAPSALATKLGIITTPPQGSCSRAYVEPGTHRFKADGVVVYNKGMLPGYSALFRHPKNELNLCVYIIPGNPQIGNDDLPYWHEHIIRNDPFISRALGDKAKIERMKVASLRFGGVPCSYGDQVILVGDAAGMIDPMTGEGIHTAMDGGRLAAAFLDEALARGNVGVEAMEIYHRQWMDKFGHDFKWSSWLSYLQYKFPIVLDAATSAIQRKGDTLMVKWADIMTSRVPKSHLLRPEYSLVVCYELVVLLFRRAVDSFRKKQGYNEDEELKKKEE